MARYFKLVYFVDGEDYDTMEALLSEQQFRAVQSAINEGKKFLMMENKVIRTQNVKEILPANEIVEEYRKMGIPLKQLGIVESPMLAAGVDDEKGRQRYEKMFGDKGFGKLMDGSPSH